MEPVTTVTTAWTIAKTAGAMHKTWLALRWILPSLAAVVIGIWVISVSRTAGQPQQGVTERKGAANVDNGEASKAIEKLTQEIQIQQQQNAEERQDHENRANQDIGIQLKLVIVGVLQAVVLALTFVVIYLQIRTARETDRAWMIGSPNMQKLDSPPESHLEMLRYFTD
jgi:hypothetical protein